MKLSIILTLLAVPACADAVWSGAGPNACAHRCGEAWAESYLSAGQVAELRVAQKAHPAPSAIQIEDGEVFTFMTYFRDGQPRAYWTTTVAELAQPAGAQGWVVGTWAWVQLDACSNWAVVERRPPPVVLLPHAGGGEHVPAVPAPPGWSLAALLVAVFSAIKVLTRLHR